MFPDNLTRAEARHRAGLIETSAYAVEVDLSGRTVTDPETRFASTTTLAFTAREHGETHVDLIADHVVRAVLDGVDLDPAEFTGARLPLRLDAGPHALTITAVCSYSRSGEGLHRFVDPTDQRTYLYTQFEAADARRMYACFEQPDLKARFTLSVVAPDAWTVVGNTLAVETADVGPGLHRTRFAETLPISTYLTVLVAGDYARVPGPPMGTEGVPSALYCRQSVVEHLDAEEILAITSGGFEVFEKHFGITYPFGKYDQVFVPEYNGGAMENVGCVTLRDEYLFRSKVTAASLDYRRNTILHELSHMWFGDLVTMRWWDDLWLKESFATWSASFAVSEQADDPELSWAAFASSSKTSAYRQDQLPSTHPVAADIVDLDAVELNFDMITYAKGASLVAQLVAYVGREAFLAGVRDYFATHAYGNTALVDLLDSLQRTSGRDLSRWSARWLETAGVNTLRLELASNQAGMVTEAAVTQTAPERHPTLREHRVALGLYGEQDGRLVRQRSDRAGRRGAAYARARPGRSGPTGGGRGQRRRPHLRQDPAGPVLPRRGPRRSAHCDQPAHPRGAVGRDVGSLPRRRAAGGRLHRPRAARGRVGDRRHRRAQPARSGRHRGVQLRPAGLPSRAGGDVDPRAGGAARRRAGRLGPSAEPDPVLRGCGQSRLVG